MLGEQEFFNSNETKSKTLDISKIHVIANSYVSALITEMSGIDYKLAFL